MFKPEKKQIAMSLAVAALGVAFVLGQYMPLSRKAGMLAEANAEIFAANRDCAAKLETLDDLKQRIEKLSLEVGNYDEKLPAERSHGVFLQKLAAVMEEQGLKDLSVRPGAEKEVKGLSIARIPVSIQCSGKLVQVFNFFRAMEEFKRIIEIRQISMSSGDDSGADVQLRAEVNIFYRYK